MKNLMLLLGVIAMVSSYYAMGPLGLTFTSIGALILVLIIWLNNGGK